MSILGSIKRFAGVSLALVVLLPCAAGGALAQSAKVTFLHVNDVYEISAKRGVGGLAELAALLNAERARSANVIMTLGGDLISPSLMSGLTKGKQMVAMMNALGLDFAGLGNHEFDFGDDVLKARMAESNFTWLATNTLGADGKPFGGASAYAMRDIGAFKVGFFSLLTPETSYLSSPGAGVKFTEVEASAKKAVADLRKQGAHFVVAITHLDLAVDRALARQVRGLDIILGGHDHDPQMIFENKTLILKAGADAHYLAVAEVTLSARESRGKMKYSIRPQWRLVSTAGVAPDAKIAALVDGFNSTLDKNLDVAVGTTAVELDSRRSSVRSMETTMGNLIADAIKAGVGAEIGFANGGGIRGDRIYDAGTTLTRKDVLTELPFGNVTVVLGLAGVDLLAALENGVSRVEDTAGRFPQVSGLSFAFDRNKPKGGRVSEVMVNGQPLDLARIYKVATNDYIAGGGDGYTALKKGKVLIDASGATLMATMVMDYIAAKGSVSPKLSGRIKSK
jgi:2',3'-cyclic-nucleotide 2'-phosphodiesterase (5'-nucleotidase family)